MALELTLEKVHAMVERTIAEEGADWIYPNAGPSCQYVDVEFTPEKEYVRGCIVGHIFIDALELDMIELAQLAINGESARQFVAYLARLGEVELPQDETREQILDYLSALQQSQDNGQPWGVAHEMAKEGLAWSKHLQAWELI